MYEFIDVPSVMEQYDLLKDITLNIRSMDFPCKPDLGLNNFRTLDFKSEGVSGDVLASGEVLINNEVIPVVIKFFRVPCPYKTIKQGLRSIIKQRNVDDKNRHEMGMAKLLTDHLLLNQNLSTPHIIFTFKTGLCTSGYETNISMCNPNKTIDKNNYLVPSYCEGKFTKYPQCAFQSDYRNHELSDTIRYLMVERASGDFEKWIINQLKFINMGKLTWDEFDYILLSMLIMISYTL